MAAMNSLRVKIVLSLIGMSIFSIALGSYVSRALLVDRFKDVVIVRSSDEFVRDVQGYYRDAGSFEQAYETESWASFQARRNQTRPPRPETDNYPNAARFTATDMSGHVWTTGGSFAVGDIISASELEDALPIFDNETQIGYVVVEGEVLLSGTETQYLAALTNSLWLSLAVVALVAVPLGVVLGKRLTGPINSLITAIRAMRPKAMYQSVPITSNDEIGLLSQSFNEMSEDLASFVEVTEQQKEKIAETETKRRQALVSISHELRTPLYRLVSQANAMLDGIRSLDDKEMKKLADSLDHLTELVDDLNDLSLSDVHRLKFEVGETDFTQLIQEALESRQDDFLKKGFNLQLSVPEKLPIEGDATRLRQTIENLLVNCIRYADPGSEISVALSSSDEHAELVISDSGPGVPADSLDSLFERFYRVEFSRSRATGGTGLGLSLVKTYAELHGGSAEAFNSDQGGLGIRVRIPLISPTFETEA